MDRMVEARIAIMRYLGLDADKCQSAIIRMEADQPIIVTVEMIVIDPDTNHPLIVGDHVKIKTETLSITYADDESEDEEGTPSGIEGVTDPGKDGRWRE